MTADLVSVPEIEASGGVANFGYYRQPNGDITVSQISPMERMAYIEDGWEWLRQYGTFDMTSEYAANHPYELLFMLGGAKEMPESQVVEMGFNIHPPKIPTCKMALTGRHKRHSANCTPYISVVFPQVTSVTPYPCSFDDCTRATPEGAFSNKKALAQHESVMHKEAIGITRTGEVLGDSIIRGLANIMGNNPAPTAKNSGIIDALNKMEFTPEQKAQMASMGITLKDKV